MSGQTSQRLVKGGGVGLKTPWRLQPWPHGRLGPRPRGALHPDGHSQMSALHSYKDLMNQLAPSCFPWLKGWDSRAFSGLQKVEACRLQNHTCLLSK